MDRFIDWASEIKKFHYANTTSNITIADVKDQPEALAALTVGNWLQATEAVKEIFKRKSNVETD